MKYLYDGLSVFRWFKKIGKWLIEPAWMGDARERYLSRILNVILLILLVWGILFEVQSKIDKRFPAAGARLALIMIGLLALAYLLNRQGQFSTATLLTFSVLIGSTFVSVLMQNVRGTGTLSTLYYLFIAIVMSELFFSMRGYLITVAIILTGVFIISLLNSGAETIFLFLLILCALIGFSSYNRRSLEREQIALAGKSARDQSLQEARLYTRTQEDLQMMTALQSISHTITSSLDINEILNNVIRLLKDSFGYTYIGVYLLDGDVLHLGAQQGYTDDVLIPEIPISAGVIGRSARSRETQFIRAVSTDPDFLRATYEVKSEIAVPLLKDENVLGVLNVESKEPDSLDENDVNLLNALAGSIAIAIDNARLHAEVKIMAMTDVVSGLANRRAFDEILQAEVTRANRYSQPISLIILDLDSFKEYNDTWGHPAGDVRLKEIADLLRANVRDPDVAVRYGGEEFAVILPNTPKNGALRLAERLRRAAEASAPYRSGNAPVAGYTISVGVATFPDDATSVKGLLIAADNAELMAKRLGKNRVCVANLPNEPPNS